MAIKARISILDPRTTEEAIEQRGQLFPTSLVLWGDDVRVEIQLDANLPGAGGHMSGEFGLLWYELGPNADRETLTRIAERVFQGGTLHFTGRTPIELDEPRVVYGDFDPDAVVIIENKRYAQQQAGIEALRAGLAAKRAARVPSVK